MSLPPPILSLFFSRHVRAGRAVGGREILDVQAAPR